MEKCEHTRSAQIGVMPYSDNSGFRYEVTACSDGSVRIEGTTGDLMIDPGDWDALKAAIDEALAFARPSLLEGERG